MRSALTATACVVPAAALAQTAPAPPPKHELAVEFAFVAATGNAETQTLGVSGEYLYRPGRWSFHWSAGYVRSETEDTVSAESLQFLFRADGELSERMSAFGQWTYFHDAFAGIEHRNVVASGLSYAFIQPGTHGLTVDGGLGYTNEQRLASDDISAAVAVTGLRYELHLSETAAITDDTSVEFSLSAADEWRATNVAAVSAKLTTVLSLKLSITIRYVHVPAPGFVDTDTVTAVALVAKF
jgi:putative salt-induced outer membrane protein YdiY